jgi:hypothetical protein
MTTITVADLTTSTLDGTGVFDVLMRANKAHLESEFLKNRIKGPEYSTVYLGSLQAVMQAALTFLLQQQKTDAEIALLNAQKDLVVQQTANAVIEGTVLTATKCKLDAEFDLLQSQQLKSAAEIALLTQKVATEKAQTTSLGVDADSVIGRQKELYSAQKDGFARDAEQKAAGILVGTWNARRMTNDDTVHDDINKLDDGTIGRTITKLLTGVGA